MIIFVKEAYIVPLVKGEPEEDIYRCNTRSGAECIGRKGCKRKKLLTYPWIPICAGMILYFKDCFVSLAVT
jgi:hypothetical protein